MPFRLNYSSILNSSLHFHWKVVNRNDLQPNQHNLQKMENLPIGSGFTDLTYFVESSCRVTKRPFSIKHVLKDQRAATI